MIRAHTRLLSALVGLGLLAAACGGGGQAEEGGGTTVEGVVKDFSVAVDPSSAPAGEVTFDVTNDGPSVHEFVVLATDLAPGSLPLNEEGTEVDESGAEGIELVGELEDIAAGDTVSLDQDLDAGSYVIICNLPGHYKQGMHTGFTVT